jgi:hypothetical protein
MWLLCHVDARRAMARCCGSRIPARQFFSIINTACCTLWKDAPLPAHKRICMALARIFQDGIPSQPLRTVRRCEGMTHVVTLSFKTYALARKGFIPICPSWIFLPIKLPVMGIMFVPEGEVSSGENHLS